MVQRRLDTVRMPTCHTHTVYLNRTKYLLSSCSWCPWVEMQIQKKHVPLQPDDSRSPSLETSQAQKRGNQSLSPMANHTHHSLPASSCWPTTLGRIIWLSVRNPSEVPHLGFPLVHNLLSQSSTYICPSLGSQVLCSSYTISVLSPLQG